MGTRSKAGAPRVESGRHQAVDFLLLLAWATFLGLPCSLVRGQDLELGGAEEAEGDFGTDTLEDSLFAEEREAERQRDLPRIRCSHFTEVWRWQGDTAWKRTRVSGYQQYASTSAAYPPRDFATPTSAEPVSTVVAVPEEGAYRLWLGYVAVPEKARPVALTLTGANEAELVFGKAALPRKPGKALQAKFPLHFESELERTMPLTSPTVVWEYRDVTLAAGATHLSLKAKPGGAVVESVFLTRSKTLLPSKTIQDKASENTLTRTWYRFRVVEPKPPADNVTVSCFIRYALRWLSRPGSEVRDWFSGMKPIAADGTPNLPVGEWSNWIDWTAEAMSGHRRGHAIVRATVGGCEKGFLEVQYAWHNHPAAVLKTARSPIWDGRALLNFPASGRPYEPPVCREGDEQGVWAMRAPDYLARFADELELFDRLLGIMAKADIRDGRTPKRISMQTRCSVSPYLYPKAIPALKRVGFNWLRGIPYEFRLEYGLDTRIWGGAGVTMGIFHASHSPLDPALPQFRQLKVGEEEMRQARAAPPEDSRQRYFYYHMGDEIGPIVSVNHINGLPDERAAFHDYLRAAAKARGESPEAHFGVETLDEVDCGANLPATPSRFDRRVHYHSKLFHWVLTGRYYHRVGEVVKRGLPNVVYGVNCSPASLLFAGTMDGGDWFALPRNGCTVAWSEDWLRQGRLSFGGNQTESYLGAVVDCAARRNNAVKLGYIVGGCGELHRKTFSYAAFGLFHMVYYNWGPRYASIDTFSDTPWTYTQINLGARALGPVEDILLDGAREPRRVALLYNRSNEIWNGSSDGAAWDRLLQFLALQHAHVPNDLILEDDLTPELLRPYQVVYINGVNLRRQGLAALAEWVRAGGTLVGTGGAAMRDEYDDPMEESVGLFGARQRIAASSDGRWWPLQIVDHTPVDTVTIRRSDLTPEMAAGVVGLKVELTPTTGRPIGSFENGACAAVVNEVGKGRTLLLGVQPGHLYAHNAPRKDWRPITYTADRRALVANPALETIKPLRVEYTEPLTEITLYEHESGLAVLVNDFSWAPGTEAVLRVRTDRKVKEVTASLRGPLEWTREGDHIVIPFPVPEPVDAVLIR